MIKEVRNLAIRLPLCCLLSFAFAASAIHAASIKEIAVEGNAKVEAAAVLALISHKVGGELDRSQVRADIDALYELGYFSDIRVFQEAAGDGVKLTIVVAEKPAITAINFSGLEEFKEDELRDQMETKLYTIINDGKIASDIRMIEKKYVEKGFYLVSVSYELAKKGKNEVEVTFKVHEQGKVLVADVHILGNTAFDPSELLDKMATRPYTRSSALASSSFFNRDLVQRDLEVISFLYRDQGYAEVKVSQPLIDIDSDHRFVRVTFQVEEGIQYRVAEVTVTGDVGTDLYTAEALIEEMKLEPDGLFRYSHFSQDIEMLVDKYGDLGFAYVDVNPVTRFDKEKKTVTIDYQIAKGSKVYFGDITVIGNSKTRDNVVRREFEIADSELYSGTRLSDSRQNINRLGFFEEVQVLRERDPDKEDVLNLKVKLKEKATGQLQAALGFTPRGETRETLFGQGTYDEKNQSGRGWNLNATARWANNQDYRFELGFLDPKVNDSEWSLGLNISYLQQQRHYGGNIYIPEERQSVGIKVGRDIIEKIRGSVSLVHTRIHEKEDIYIFEGYRSEGMKNSLIFNLTRRDVDNYLDPTEGSEVLLSQHVVGGVLGGDYQFLEWNADARYFYPVDFSETYRTYFKLTGVAGIRSPFGGAEIPPTERYRLGGFNNLRGFGYWDIGPKDIRSRSPLGDSYRYNLGGDKQLYFQLEYFLPLIPQAGIKSLLFTDFGRVYSEGESFSFKEFEFDVGFGLRWITPIAPFRFEWAFPWDREKEEFGDMEFILTLGF